MTGIMCICKYTYTRLLGCFAPIFYLNCEHVLFVYILKQRRKRFCGFLKKKSRILNNFNLFTKLKTFKTHFFKILIILKPSCGHVMSHKKIGPDQFSRFGVYWIQTNRQAKFIYRYVYLSARECSILFYSCFSVIPIQCIRI